MKTMTEFIMEQEAPQVVEESFNEADLVSQFMALQAASANMSCILEFATIAEFCNENEIKMPESLVQEGFADVMDKIFTGIANFFQKIVDWFKGLVKGASATFSKAKISELIAKLKTSNFEGGKLSKEISEKVVYVNATYKILWQFFLNFKESLKDYKDAVKDGAEIAGDPDAGTDKYAKFMNHIDGFISDLELFKTESKWYKSGGTVDTSAFAQINSTVVGTPITVDPSNIDQLPVDDAVKILENINKFNIPKQADQLLKALDIDKDTSFALVTKDEVDETDTDGKPTGKKKDKYSYSKTAAAVRDAKAKIDKCSKLLAAAYEKVTEKLTTVYSKALKDVDTPSDKAGKERYDERLSAAKSAAGKGDIDKDAKAL